MIWLICLLAIILATLFLMAALGGPTPRPDLVRIEGET